MKIICYALFLVVVLTRNYPLYKQCDPTWRDEQLGTSTNTICSAGCLMSSMSMALTGIGKNYNPSTLNKWLTSNGGYVSGDLFVWASVNSQGVTFLDAGRIVVLNVHNGGHWVLAYSYSGDTIFVNDPGYSTTSYTLSQIVDGQNGIYSVNNGGWYSWFESLYSNIYFGYLRQLNQ